MGEKGEGSGGKGEGSGGKGEGSGGKGGGNWEWGTPCPPPRKWFKFAYELLTLMTTFLIERHALHFENSN